MYGMMFIRSKNAQRKGGEIRPLAVRVFMSGLSQVPIQIRDPLGTSI